MVAVMIVMGFSFGLATTLSITIVVDMTSAGAQGTANSLRIMGNRTGQFVMPFGASGSRKSPHFFDQAELYSTHRFKPAWFTKEEVANHAKITVELKR